MYDVIREKEKKEYEKMAVTHKNKGFEKLKKDDRQQS